MSAKKEIEIIEELCNKHGLNLREVFRKANESESTIQNWRRKNPRSLEVRNKVHEAIEQMVKEKEA